MLPPAARLPAKDLKRFVDQELYWVLHAPRQTGKTSFLIAWMHALNASEQVVACYVSVESCQGIEDISESMPALCKAILKYSQESGVVSPCFLKSWAAGRRCARPSPWWCCSTRWTLFRGRLW